MMTKKIALITDTHLEEEMPFLSITEAQEHFEEILSDIANRNIKDIIFCGDIGSKKSHDSFFDALKIYSYNLVLGNHDIINELNDRLHTSHVSEEFCYYYDEYGFRFIMMDSSKGNVSQEQLSWLKSITNTHLALLIFIHHPLLKIPTTVDTLYPLKNRADIVHILHNLPSDCTVFCGHYHMNDERTYKNITQLTTSAVSYQIQKNTPAVQIDTSTFGYRIIEISDNTVFTQVITFKSIK
mgnify:CR=1 FL=1